MYKTFFCESVMAPPYAGDPSATTVPAHASGICAMAHASVTGRAAKIISMIAIMTVTGVDNTGIIAAVTTNLAELGVNIVDVSQTLMSGFFTMILRVEFDEQKVSLEQIQERMNTVGEKINQSIRVQSEALFTAMNEI